jgi:hypothetical protein
VASGSHPARHHPHYSVSPGEWKTLTRRASRASGMQKARGNSHDLYAKMITAGAWSHMGLTLAPPATTKITKES